MNNNFQHAMADVFGHEGGFSDNRNDKGGVTNLGISIRFLKTLPIEAGDINGDGHISESDIVAMDAANASDIYRQFFWEHYRLDEIKSRRVSTKAFNCFVNMRGKTAAQLMQRAANDLGANLVVDGILGSRSIAVLNQLDEHQLMVCLKWRMWEIYKAIIKNDATQSVFEKGWQRRAFSDV
ncbi:hypothetical protein A1OW_10335 [Enterovibrio norvegicus]|uniref:glycoside hydrolase family 108 protein n=1 Tax=Enterovibrio norvegicus TaxID=188144 RepID=UPI0002EFACC8|nr:glycosyl hydrolase 108 family protein [Enterovibrio norvegicus]OEF50990.1 hypothetical protein A1OW_10335 [Enterovibrio norvegicus]